MQIKAAIFYGPSKYEVAVDARWTTLFSNVRDPLTLSKLAVQFFGEQSGGFHGAVRADGAMWSDREGRLFLAGNGWSLEIIHDAPRYAAHVAATLAALNANDFDGAGKLMNAGTRGEFTREALARSA